MKLSTLLATSLTLLSVLAVGISAEARNPAKDLGTGITLGTPYVFAAECGTDPLTQANFQSTTAFPLNATVNESTTLTGGYAGELIFTPVANLDLTNLATFTSPLPQGTFSQTVNVNPSTYSSQFPGIEQAVAYSWVNNKEKTKFGISFIPASFITNFTQFTNQALKGKAFQTTMTSDTLLTDLYNAGALVNLIGNDPGKNATNFQLLGIGSALVNLDAAGTNANARFNDFALNTVALPKALGANNNIFCGPFLVNNPAAAAAARAH